MQKLGDAHDTLVTAELGGPLEPGIVCGVQVAADAGVAAPTPSRPQTTAARRAHLPIPIPIRMRRPRNPT